MYEILKFTEMTTRRVIDAKDKDGEKVYVKGHAKATYMSDGRTVEDAIKQIGTGGGEGGGKEVVKISNGVIELLERNKIYIVEDGSLNRTFEIQAIEGPMWGDDYIEYTVIFSSEDDMGSGKPLSITLPDNVYWANGQIPDLTLNANYELSIVGWEGANNSGFNAVITPFKPV